MEKEEQKWEQEELEEEQEEEETSLHSRKSRPVNGTESAVQRSHGTLETNGHEIQSSVTADGSKDIESTLENGEEKDELDGHVGSGEEISNGLQKLDNLVFFDEDEGNEFTSPVFGGQQIEKNNGHNELDIMSPEFDALHDSTSAVNGGHLDDDSSSYSNHQQNGNREDDVLSNSDLKSSGEIESEEVYVVPGDELEVTQIDLERVLQKQTTHDLYCPNCNSCITQRVILRKRKRGIRLSAQDIKRNKLEAVVDSKLNAGSFQASGSVVHETDYIGVDSAPLLTTNDTDHDREPDWFRCLSCFSFFFPTGNGFKLLPKFEGKKVKVTVKDEQVPSTKKNWFASMLEFNKPATEVTRGSKLREEAQPPPQASGIPVPSRGNTVKTKVLVGGVSEKAEENLEATIGHFEAYSGDQLQESKSGTEAQTNLGTNLSTKTPPEVLHFTNEESSEDNISSSKGRVYPTEESHHIFTKTKFEVHTGESVKNDGIPSIKGSSIVQGKDTVIIIDAQSVGSSQTGQSITCPEEPISGLHSASQVTVADAGGTEVRNEFEIEVIKSIVYGGLVESITSLGVVSSAAGGGAATLNILALGIASLIGGLFVICHNLWELRSECIQQAFNNHVSPVSEQSDRYKELLGRKENFTLHATVSILSYILFGLVAPVAYGFSFRKSDNKEFKLIVVAAASLVCICGLSVGRAYVRKHPRPYVKSVAKYLILGFMVSGVSYVSGVLVERILEKLGLFQPSSGANLLLPQMKTPPSYSGWTSF